MHRVGNALDIAVERVKDHLGGLAIGDRNRILGCGQSVDKPIDIKRIVAVRRLGMGQTEECKDDHHVTGLHGDVVQAIVQRSLNGPIRGYAMGTALTLALLSLATPALAKRPQILTVVGTNEAGQPIPNAWVRVPGYEGRRDVEPETGVWETSTLYRNDGAAMIFTKGMDIEFNVTAPGFVPARVAYRVRPRRQCRLRPCSSRWSGTISCRMGSPRPSS